ncbi:hypothetical protein EW026_g3485 [Hermanssonia centrifuga]|uniref:Amidase domain-containing protein n=1 Tax=Hermanssonia centrifuga TaxID=98765 RepID=A0A4S4KL66_9APHY|nr:hypothetical protein EW026_g3485 [Hermanssonia centrifuga]
MRSTHAQNFKEYFPAETDRSVLGPLKQVIKNLQKVGVTVVPVQLPSTPYALSAYYVIASAEASSNMARYDGIQYGLRVDPPPGADARKAADVYGYTRTQCFGPEVKRRILLGTYALSADAFDNYFLQAQRVRKLIRADFDKVFRHANVLMTGETSVGPEGVDVLLHPSAIRTAPPIPDASIAVENSSEESNGLESSLEDYVQDVLTVPASLAGLPAISVPAGLADDQWPIGVSVVGQWGYDEMVLRVAEIIEDTGRDAAV